MKRITQAPIPVDALDGEDALRAARAFCEAFRQWDYAADMHLRYELVEQLHAEMKRAWRSVAEAHPMVTRLRASIEILEADWKYADYLTLEPGDMGETPDDGHEQ